MQKTSTPHALTTSRPARVGAAGLAAAALLVGCTSADDAAPSPERTSPSSATNTKGSLTPELDALPPAPPLPAGQHTNFTTSSWSGGASGDEIYVFTQPGAQYVEYQGTNPPNRIGIGVVSSHRSQITDATGWYAYVFVTNSEAGKTVTDVELTIGGTPYPLEAGVYEDPDTDGFSFTTKCTDLPRSSRLPVQVDATLSDGTTFSAFQEMNTAQRDTAGRSCFRTQDTSGLSLDPKYPAIP